MKKEEIREAVEKFLEEVENIYKPFGDIEQYEPLELEELEKMKRDHVRRKTSDTGEGSFYYDFFDLESFGVGESFDYAAFDEAVMIADEIFESLGYEVG